MLQFSELKRQVPNQKFWIKFIIWQRTAEAAQMLLYVCVDNSIFFPCEILPEREIKN
jgi:hypothetical protein